MAEQKSRRERAAGLLEHPPVRWLASLVPLRPGLVALSYHRIAEPGSPPLDRGLWSATPPQFASQLQLLQREFDVISAAELEQVLEAGRGRHVMITFDDGYRDNYEHAFPALRAAGLPATFFLSTGFLDDPKLTWWDEIAWMLSTGRGAPPPTRRSSRRPTATSGCRGIAAMTSSMSSASGPGAAGHRRASPARPG